MDPKACRTLPGNLIKVKNGQFLDRGRGATLRALARMTQRPGRAQNRGLFVTFEGGEGSGKTTQIAKLAEHLRQNGAGVVVTREPGGTPGADAIRHVVLSGAAQVLGSSMEAMLFAAARADHVDCLIAPALDEGRVVLCDRFHDSTRVYQGLSGVGLGLLKQLEWLALAGHYPDLTILLDIDAESGLRRAAERRGSAAADRFERESVALHEERRIAFLAIAAKEPDRFIVIDARRPAVDIAAEIAGIVDLRLRLAGMAGSIASDRDTRMPQRAEAGAGGDALPEDHR